MLVFKLSIWTYPDINVVFVTVTALKVLRRFYCRLLDIVTLIEDADAIVFMTHILDIAESCSFDVTASFKLNLNLL